MIQLSFLAVIVLFACSPNNLDPVMEAFPITEKTMGDKALATLTEQTLGKFSGKQVAYVAEAGGSASVVYFSGSEKEIFACEGYPATGYQGLVFMEGGKPLWAARDQEGDALLSVSLLNVVGGRPSADGGLIITGKNDLPKEKRFQHFLVDLGDDGLRSLVLFHGWQPVHLNDPDHPDGLSPLPHVLATHPHKTIMLAGLAPGSPFEIGLIRMSRGSATHTETPGETTYDLGEVRTCSAPNESFVAIQWNSCVVLRPG